MKNLHLSISTSREQIQTLSLAHKLRIIQNGASADTFGVAPTNLEASNALDCSLLRYHEY